MAPISCRKRYRNRDVEENGLKLSASHKKLRMDHSYMLFIFLIALVSSYEICKLLPRELIVVVNDASTAYASCQDALDQDPTAVDGLYYVNNHGHV